MSTPAGWYPDSEVPGGQRYWDGTSWTEHRAAGPAGAAAAPVQTVAYAPPVAPQGAPPVAPSSGGSKPWFKRWYVWVGIVLALLVLGSVLSPKSSNTATPASTTSPAASTPAPADTASATPTPEQSTAAPADTTPGIGAKVADGKFDFTVNSVKCGVKSVGDSVLSTKAQGQFCLINVTIANNGDVAQTFFDGNQKVFDAQGRQFSADTTAAIYANPSDAQVFIAEINPGNSVKGTMVFDVPKTAKVVKIELHDSAFSGGVEVSLT